MKRVPVPVEPQVLADFRRQNPDGTWAEFKNEPGNTAVFDCLAAAQGYLCAYCEISIHRPLRGEVEHFAPKGAVDADLNRHLAFDNMLATCEGGTRPSSGERVLQPIRETMHCGALKGAQDPADTVLDPRLVPCSPPIWRITSLGALEVDREACQRAGIDWALANSTLEILGLNRRGLLRMRATVIEDLDNELFSGADGEGHDPTQVAARATAVAADKLLPDDEGRLMPFWTTIRAWAPPAIEEFIAANGWRIPGML